MALNPIITREPGQIQFLRWNPLCLSKKVLYALALLLVALLTLLAVSLATATGQKGLDSSAVNDTVWTYFPTALLVLLTGIYRQNDHHCKQLAPWAALAAQEASADSTVLLDFISPVQPLGLFAAIRRRSSAVGLSSTAILLLKVLTVFSTALFTSSPFVGQPTENLVQKSPFNDALQEDISVSSFGLGSAFEAYGASSQGLATRAGLNQDFIYEVLVPSEDLIRPNTTVIVEVQALEPIFECQPAPFEVIFPPENTTDFNPELKIRLLFPECTLRGGDGTGVRILSLNPAITRTPPRQLSPLRQRIDCLNRTTENWQLITLADLRYNQMLHDADNALAIGDSVSALSWFTSVEKLIGVACRSSYAIHSAKLTYTSNKGWDAPQAELLPEKTSRSLSSLNNASIGDITDTALQAAANMAGRVSANAFAEELPDTMFKLMAGSVGGTYASLLNEDVMLKAAERVLKDLAIQALDRHMRNNSTVQVQASISTAQRHLTINSIAAIVTLVGLGLLCVLTILLAHFAPRNVTNCNPELLASAMYALKQSPSLLQLLRRARDGNAMLKHVFNGYVFTASADDKDAGPPSSGIVANQPSEPFPGSGTNGKRTSKAVHAYRPATTRLLWLVLFLSFPLALIVALEVTQRMSDNHNGLASVNNPRSKVIQSLPRVLSAIIMVSVGAAFSSIEFNTLMFAPIRYFQNISTATHHATKTAYLGQLTPQVMWTAIRRHHWPVLLATVAAMIGSFLAIMSSGLYSFEEFSKSEDVSIDQEDVFRIEWAGSVLSDNDATVIHSLVESANLGFPSFTADTVALPSLVTPSFLMPDDDQIRLLEMQLPAVQAALDCTFADADSYNFSATFNSRIRTARAEVSALVPLPADCQRGGRFGNASSLTFTESMAMTTNNSFVSKLLDLHVGPWDGSGGESTNEFDPLHQPTNPSTCPTLAFIYGHASLEIPSQTAGTLLICYQQLHTLQMTTTFSLPNMSVSNLHPPRPVPSTKRPLFYPNTTSPNTPYRPQRHFDNAFTSFDQLSPDANRIFQRCSFRSRTSELANITFDSTNPALDPFFQGVLCSKPYLPIENLGLTDTSSRQRVLASIEAFYQRYMAIAVSKNMRIPLSTEAILATTADENPSLVAGNGGFLRGTVLNARTEVRIVQQRVPKLILQGMLAVMVMCGGLSVFLGKLWVPVARWNPCTIAGRMGVVMDIVEAETNEDEDSHGGNSPLERLGLRQVTCGQRVQQPNVRIVGGGLRDVPWI